MSNIEKNFNLGPWCEDHPQYAEKCPIYKSYYNGLGCSKFLNFMSKYCKKTCNESCGGGKFYLLFNGQKFAFIVTCSIFFNFIEFRTLWEGSCGCKIGWCQGHIGY